MDDLKLIIGRSNEALGEAIAHHLGVEKTKLLLSNFADGEIRIQILENIRGKDVFIIESTQPAISGRLEQVPGRDEKVFVPQSVQPQGDNLLELLLLLDATRRASARRVTAVIPYFGYARQERKDRPRVPISAKLVANLIVAAGADRVLTIDLHSPAIQGFFDVPTDHLISDWVFVNFITQQMPKYLDIPTPVRGGDLVIVSPDIGGVKRVEKIAQYLGASIAIIYKRRSAPNEAQVVDIVGEVRGKVAIIVDDIIDTAGTVVKAAHKLRAEGARLVVAIATHPLLSYPAVDRLADSEIDLMAVTDTVPLSEEAKSRLCPHLLKVISVAPLFAAAIKCIHEERSLSGLFKAGSELFSSV